MRGLVLVTGATGLIGRYVVEQLLERGTSVRVLARDPSRLAQPVQQRADIVQGALTDRATLERAVDGVGLVVHLAACARAWSSDPDEFTAVNVRGVELLLAAATRARVARVVHVSTVLTLPELWSGPAGMAAETTPYVATKLAGEQLVDRWAASGRDAVVVHPTRVYGPGPMNDANGVTRLVAMYLSWPIACHLDDGDVLANYVHAADVAAGILLAAGRGRSGAHYVLGGENSSLRGLLGLVGELSGVRRPLVGIPRPAAIAAAHAAVLWGRMGGSTVMTPAWVRSCLTDQRVSSEAAGRDLGYRPRSLRQGLEETIAWLRPQLPAAS
jgi:farnesol dehydrogenase